MKKILMITAIALAMVGLFAATQTLLAQSSGPDASTMASETMRTANQLYEVGDYGQAIQAYQHLVDQGYSDSALYFNIGNAYFKQADYGRAVANYRRAQRLAPRDEDIEANLKMARAQVVDQFEAVDEGGLLTQVGESIQGHFTLNELAMVALGAWILFVLLLLLYGSARAGNSWRKAVQYGLVMVAIVVVVGVLAMGSYLYADNDQAIGVVVAAEVDVTSGPGAQYVTEFTLHSGAEVDLVESRGSWIRLVLPGGDLEGWVPATAIENLTG